MLHHFMSDNKEETCPNMMSWKITKFQYTITLNFHHLGSC